MKSTSKVTFLFAALRSLSVLRLDRLPETLPSRVQATPIEGTHCRHCDDDPTPPADAPEETSIRRVTLRRDAFHRIDTGQERTGQLSGM